MRGCSSIALNTGAAPSTENAKSGQVLVRTRSGEKGRPVAPPDEPPPQPDGAVPRSPQTLELRTFNGKRKKRTGFGSHPGRRKRQASGGSGRAAAATRRGCSSIASNTGAAHLQRKTQKADRFWFAPGAAKKAGQWRLRTSRCCNHAGLFLDRPKHRSPVPSTENAKKRTGFGSHAGR